MKLRLLILLAAALAASPAAGQTVKSLGFNTTNGQVVYSGTNTLTFTNPLDLTNTVRVGVFGQGTATGFAGRSSGGNLALYGTNVSSSVPAFYGWDGFNNTAFSAGVARTNLGLSTTDAVTFQSLVAEQFQVRLGTNLYVSLADDVSEFFTDVSVDAELAVLDIATFSTNVTVNGNLSVGSLTTTTPSTWALDATQTAADTNGVLALPSNANVIRLTNNNAISGVSGGVLGAFYYLVNQTTNTVTISNVGGITVQGGTPLTLGANQAATLVATGATNASVAARGDLNDVTLGGTLNIAPAQTANSGDSLMTRDLVAQRLPFQLVNYDPVTSAMGAVTSSNGGSGTPSVNKFDLRGGTNTNGVAVWGAGSGGGLGIKSSGRGNVGWQGRVSVGWSISRILTNSEVRLQFGKDSTDRTFSSLTNRGVGIYITNTSVFFETHDGTNHFQTTNSLTTSGDGQNDSWMAVTANGVASFYKNGTLITNVTNNVPNSQSSSAAFGYVIGVQNTTTNNSGVRIGTTPGFILQD